MSELDRFLAESAPPKPHRRIDSMPDLKRDIERFLDLKYSGDPRAHMSLCWLYTHKLRPHHGGPVWEAARSYVSEVLRRDPATGAPRDTP